MEKPLNSNVNSKETARIKMQKVLGVAGEALTHDNINNRTVRQHFYKRLIQATEILDDLLQTKSAIVGGRKIPDNLTHIQTVICMLDDLIDFFSQKHGGLVNEQTKKAATVHFESITSDHRATGIMPVPSINLETRKQTQRLFNPSADSDRIDPKVSAVRTVPSRVATRLGIANPLPEERKEPELPLEDLVAVAARQLEKFRLITTISYEVEEIRRSLTETGIKTDAPDSNMRRSVEDMIRILEKKTSFPRSILLVTKPMKRVEIQGAIHELNTVKAKLETNFAHEVSNTARFFGTFAKNIQQIIDRIGNQQDIPPHLRGTVEEIIRINPIVKIAYLH